MLKLLLKNSVYLIIFNIKKKIYIQKVKILYLFFSFQKNVLELFMDQLYRN